MIWLSVLIVFGAYAWYISLLYWKSSTRPPGMRLFIHTPSPLPLIAPVAVGVLIGVLGAIQESSWWSWLIIGLEAIALGLIIAGVTVMSRLPEHEAKVAVGDFMPPYSLIDQDGKQVRVLAGEPVAPSLYVFYRGHW